MMRFKEWMKSEGHADDWKLIWKFRFAADQHADTQGGAMSRKKMTAYLRDQFWKAGLDMPEENWIEELDPTTGQYRRVANIIIHSVGNAQVVWDDGIVEPLVSKRMR